MASSLLSGVSGLRVHQSLLDTVGNNLANINTIGYKTARIRFADLLSEDLRPATGAVDNRVGGTNPLQIGLGVRVAAVDTILKQGSIEATGNELDLAIQGDGFFVATDGIANFYTRAGAFAVDEENNLVDPATGYRIVRYGTVGEGDGITAGFQTPGDPSIQIPTGTSIAGRATASVTFTGNLNALALGPLAETLSSGQPYLSAGVAATAATLLNDLDSNSFDYQVGDTISITGTDAAGNAVNTTLNVDGTTTLGDLLTAINAAFSQTTASLLADGTLQLQADNVGPATLNLTLADGGSNTGFTSFTNHSMALTADGKFGDRVTSGIQIFDTQGSPHNITFVFQKQGNNLWDMTASIDAADGTMIDNIAAGIQFNDDGSFRQVVGTGNGDGDISIQLNNLATPQTIALNFSSNGFDGLTQFGGASSAAATEQDGLAAGFLTGLAVGPDGVIEGVFTNGRTLPLAQLALANFANPGGLERLGDNYFGITTNSGIPLIGTALSGGRGLVQSGALENSNVDVALEFTRLITAQRGFQVNARTITATDSVLQELSNIVR
jgi:flagellar hook protein FlgE